MRLILVYGVWCVVYRVQDYDSRRMMVQQVGSVEMGDKEKQATCVQT